MSARGSSGRTAAVTSGRAPPAAGAYPRIEVTSRDAWRVWLERHHATSSGVWAVSWKKGSGMPQVSMAELSEEALCFGWVDSLPRKLDARRSMLLVTPRKARSGWSRVNKERVERLLRAGRMAPAGIAVVEAARRSGTWNALDEVEALAIPDDLAARFARGPAVALRNFDAFPRSVKRAILEWIQSARRPETRARRVEETVSQAARNVRANQWRQPRS